MSPVPPGASLFDCYRPCWSGRALLQQWERADALHDAFFPGFGGIRARKTSELCSACSRLSPATAGHARSRLLGQADLCEPHSPLPCPCGKEGSGMPGRGKPRMTPSAGLTQRDRGFILWADTMKTNLHFCAWT